MRILLLIREFFKSLSADQYRFLIRNLLRRRFPKRLPPLPPEDLVTALEAFYEQMSTAQREALCETAQAYISHHKAHQ